MLTVEKGTLNDVARILALQHILGATNNGDGFVTSAIMVMVRADFGKTWLVFSQEITRLLMVVGEIVGVAIGVQTGDTLSNKGMYDSFLACGQSIKSHKTKMLDTYRGRAFIGWTDGVNIYEPNTDVAFPAEDTTLYAVWDGQVTVRFSVNGGSAADLPSYTVQPGEEIDFPEYNGTKKGH